MAAVRRHSIALLLLIAVHADASSSWDAFGDSSWTERLGLSFMDDCQESVGLAAVWAVRHDRAREPAPFTFTLFPTPL